MDPNKLKSKTTDLLEPKKNLDALRVNRFLYKAEIPDAPENSVFMSANIYSRKTLKNKEKEGEATGDILTGSVLVSCFVRTSNKNTRVELVPVSENQSGEDVFGEETFIDALIAWRDVNQPAVVIDQNGLWTDELFINGLMTVLGDLDVIGTITIDSIPVPFSQWGLVNSDGSAISLPPGWSSAEGPTGVYTVTHNRGFTGNYAVLATPFEASGLIRLITVASIGANSFVLAIRDSGGVLTSTIFSFNIVYDSGAL